MVKRPRAALREFEEDVERLQAHAGRGGGARAGARRLGGLPRSGEPGGGRGGAAAGPRGGRIRRRRRSPLWRLDDLVETAGNRMVLEAAARSPPSPGQRYNPLVLVGASGVGKTHLLHAIGNALAASRRRRWPASARREFTGELIEAIDRDAVAAWRARYRRGGRVPARRRAPRRRQGPDAGRAVRPLQPLWSSRAASSSSPPRRPLAELTGVEARLRSRLEGGLVVELPAARSPRCASSVLARDLEAKLGAADAELAAYLASRPADSVRAAQALLQRVLDAAEARRACRPPPRSRARCSRAAAAAAAPAPSAAGRSSGIVAPGAGAARSREKMVWEWPEVGDRVVEEWR